MRTPAPPHALAVLLFLLAACSPGCGSTREHASFPLPVGRAGVGPLAADPVPPGLEPMPASEPPSPPSAPVRRPGAYANLDPGDDFVVGPPESLDDCEGDLARAGIRFARYALPVHTEKQRRSSLVCGAPQVVVYLRGPGKIEYHPAPVVTCSMALALASFERVLQEESLRVFSSLVARIDQLGTYVCREIAAFPGLVSEHSYANAIDIGRFVLKSGRSIEIVRDFKTSDGEPKKAPGTFLRAVSRRANDEDIFSHVLTPFFDAVHKNHFHLDLARYRTDGTRPR